MDLKAVAVRKFKVTTDSKYSNPVFENVLDSDFSTTAINQKWVGDITYVSTDEGWLYLAVIIDLYLCSVIRWSMSKRMKKYLVFDALFIAPFKRKFSNIVVMHKDRDSQYFPKKHRVIIKKKQVDQLNE